jgi:hypothetical protein
MRVAFKKSIQLHDRHFAIKQNDYCVLNFTVDEIARIKNLLFKSFDENHITIITEEYGGYNLTVGHKSYYFEITFKREEDENFFLIWANDGIDI